ncbi:MAG: PQQ-like beta-propeller repeat protein [Planctomycetes bacterium]|nr:PQQ-like beta-propeller repeat protein [Planctomycetota bacterium]MCB9891546.1 PQQ-like beta-propeller repeat protein [Planctomycetota bacterium]
MNWLLTILIACATHGDWPAFLGRGAEMTSQAVLPLTWNQEAIAWKHPLPGHGQSSPVILGKTIYVTAVEGPNKERYHVLAIDRASGEETWRHTVANSAPQTSSLFVSRAAPTPCVDASGIFVFFESGQVIALTHEGEERWARDLQKDHGAFQGRFGLGSSPCQSADRIVLLIDHEGPSYVIALDKASGETLWRTERTSRVSWSSPIVTEIAGVPQVVVSSAGSVDGYDLTNGKLLWAYDGVGGNTLNTPHEFGEGRFLIGASPGEGRDVDPKASRSNLALAVTRTEEGRFTPRVLWSATRVTSSFSSPIAHDGLGYYVNRAGVLYALDLETGERVYEERLGTACWATPIPSKGRVTFFGKDGDSVVVRTGRTFEILATNRLWEAGEGAPSDPAERGADQFGGRIQYGVALSDDGLYVRTGDWLYAIPVTKD